VINTKKHIFRQNTIFCRSQGERKKKEKRTSLRGAGSVIDVFEVGFVMVCTKSHKESSVPSRSESPTQIARRIEE